MIRKNMVAGQFYPGNRAELIRELDAYFQAADWPGAEIERVHGIIAPHAGYVFSGMQAAKAYKAVEGDSFSHVCVVSPSHYDYFTWNSHYHGDAYETPLGRIEIDRELAGDIAAEGAIINTDRGHGREHALEVQLPFLQYALMNDFKLIPIVMGAQSGQTVADLKNTVTYLHKKFGENVLFVASSDLSHFHSADEAERLDLKCIKRIMDFDGEGMWADVQKDGIEACGAGPMSALLQALKEVPGMKIHALGYSHSGQTIPDRNSVVGYTSAIIYE